MPVKPVRSRRLYEQIAEQIEQLIKEQEFRPGDRLPSETALARSLGVSRPSVREAMIALETAGLIDVRTGDGTYVRQVPSGDLVLPWAVAGDAGPGTLEQFEVREVVEVEVARRAAKAATAEEIEELSEILERDTDRYILDRTGDDLAYAFHVGLAKACGNRILHSIVKTLWDMRAHEMWRVIRERVVRPEHKRMVLTERRALVEALRRRDGAAAAAAMRRLLKAARKRLFEEEVSN